MRIVAEILSFVWNAFNAFLIVVPFAGLLYFTYRYIRYFVEIQRNPPKDKPNVRVWNARILLVIPLLLFAKFIFLPFIFLLRPEWIFDFLVFLLVIGWFSFLYAGLSKVYASAVGLPPLPYRLFKEVESNLSHGEYEPGVFDYVKTLYWDQLYKGRYVKWARGIFDGLYLFGRTDPERMAITSEIKIISKIRADKREPLYYPKGYSVSLSDITKHVHVLAPTGSGKTKSIFGPLIQQTLDKGMGIVLADPKGDTEVINSVLGMMEEQGRLDQVRFFDLAYPELSHSYNPLATNDPTTCQSIINATLPATPGGDFYVSKQKEFVKAIMGWMEMYQSIMGDEAKKFNFIDLYAILAYLPESLDLLLEKVDVTGARKDKLKEAWVKGIQQEATTDKRYSGFLAGLRQHISRYAFMANATWLINDYNPDVNVAKDLKSGKIITFFLRALSYPAGEAEDIGKMLLMDVQSYAAKKQERGASRKIPNVLFIDEASSILPQPADSFLKMLAMARSAGVGVVISHQNKTQFDEKTFETIATNSATRILPGAGNFDTAKFFSEISKKEVVYQHTVGTSGYNIFSSVTEWLLPHWTSMAREDRVPTVEPEDLMDMPIGESYVFSKRDKGLFVLRGKTYFFAKEYDYIKIQNLFPVNEERMKKWREGGLNLIDELSDSLLESKGVGAEERERVKNAKFSTGFAPEDFSHGQTAPISAVTPDGYEEQPAGESFDPVSDPSMIPQIDGDVDDTDFVGGH